MAWRGETIAAVPWAIRRPIAVDGTASASTADRDVTVTIPVHDQAFWSAVDALGYQVLFTEADGVTVIEHRRQTWDYNNKSAVFNILGDSGAGNAWGPAVANAMSVLWMYVGYTNWTDLSVVTAPAGAFTGHLCVEAPGDVIPYSPDRPDARKPTVRRSKQTAERAAYWIDVTDALPLAQKAYAGSPVLEEVLYADVTSERAGVATAIEVETAVRFAWYRNRMFIRAVVSGGTDGNDYVVRVKFGTTNPSETGEVRTMQQTILVQVRNPDDVG